MIAMSQSMVYATDFTCNFENASDADKWNIVSIVSTGSWAVTSGTFGNVFRFNRGTASGTENIISAKNVTMTNGIVSSDIILHEKSISGAASGILFRYVDASNYYMLRLHCSQLKLQLYKKVGGTFTLLKETGLSAINVDQVYNLKAKVEGGNITCYLDNVKKITATDNALTSGTIGFRIFDQSVSVDNVLVNPDVIVSSNSNISGFLLSSGTNVTVTAGNLTINQNDTVKSITVAPNAKLTYSSGITLTTVNGINLQSSSAGTATLLDSYNVPTINATVQQYVEEGRNWYMSSPISGANYTVLDKGSYVVNFNETTKGWETITTGNLAAGRGYIQVATVGQGTTGNVSFSGTTNSGDISTTLTRTGTTSAGFNLVGNPYPSYLDWSIVAPANPNILPTCWFRTKNLDDSYTFATVNVATPSSPIIVNNNANTTITKYIPPMQAYWVRVVDGQSSIDYSVTNSMRDHADNELNTMKVRDQFQQQLLRLQVSNGSSSDETVVYFNPNAADTYDAFDSPKMSNANSVIPEIYTIAGTEHLVINGLKSIIPNQELSLGFTSGVTNNFSIKATEISNFDVGTRIILKDNQTNTEQDLTDGTAYTFSSDAVSTASRFSVIFKTSSITTTVNNTFNNNSIFVFKNANNKIVVNIPTEIVGKARVFVYNVVGQNLENEFLTNTVNLLSKSYTSGVYLVNVLTKGKTITHKVVIN